MGRDVDAFMPDVVRRFDLPQPSGDAALWCSRIGERRRRPIHVRHRSAEQISAVIGQPAGAEPGPCGILLETADADYIAVDADAPLFLQNHAILHELGHVLWGHEGTDLTFDEEYQAERTADVLAATMSSHQKPSLMGRFARYSADLFRSRKGDHAI